MRRLTSLGLGLVVLGTALAAATPTVPAAGMGHPSKEERLEHWRELDPAVAYNLFKACRRTPPAELALQFNPSITVNPWSQELRQAGGSPGTAVVIPDTYPGASFSDQGDTRVLSNYLSAVPAYGSGDCPLWYGYYSNDAWYEFTLDRPTRVQANTCGAGTGFDTILGVFNRTLDQVVGNDDSCGNSSSLACCLDPGTYYVVVDGYGAGPYELAVSFAECASAQPPAQGGPDSFGYRWIQSGTTRGPDFNWLDISASGTAVALGDDASAQVPLGFSFPYYWNSFTSVFIGSNGILSFDGTWAAAFENTNLPNPVGESPNNLICGFWDDLNPSIGGSIRYLSDPAAGRFIVQYTDVPSYSGVGTYTFQIILDQAGDILVQYLSISLTNINEATVGIEDSGGGDGLQVNCNGAGARLSDHSVLRFIRPQLDHGGPDAFGYTWATSHSDSGPVYGWPAFNYHAPLNLGDNQTANLELPFAFPFYGVNYTSVQVCSNGWLSFGNHPPVAEDSALPGTAAPNNAIYVLWDDLAPATNMAVSSYRVSADGYAEIHWDSVPSAANPAETFTFEVTLWASGEIVVQYKDLPETRLASCTIGLENATGTVGLQARHHLGGCVLEDSLAIRFTPPAGRPTRGGGGGYDWINSRDSAGPSFSFVDISTTGTDLNVVGDDVAAVVDLPFEFPFYGEKKTRMWVSSNGVIHFGSGVGLFRNTNLPWAEAPNDAIYVFWDDLLPQGSGCVRYRDDSAQGRVVVQWTNMRSFEGYGPHTFQAQLYRNGEIHLSYQVMNTMGLDLATVGVENGDGSQGVPVNYNGNGGQLLAGTTVVLCPNVRQPAAITDLRVSPLDFGEGAATVLASWTPVTTDTVGNRLQVDHYLLEAVSGPGYDFSAPYREALYPVPRPDGRVYAELSFGNIGMLDNVFFRIRAVDNNGRAWEGSPPATGSPRVAR